MKFFIGQIKNVYCLLSKFSLFQEQTSLMKDSTPALTSRSGFSNSWRWLKLTSYARMNVCIFQCAWLLNLWDAQAGEVFQRLKGQPKRWERAKKMGNDPTSIQYTEHNPKKNLINWHQPILEKLLKVRKPQKKKSKFKTS